MEKYSKALLGISNKASLFETDGELDDFLKEVIAVLMNQAGASLGAIFVYDETLDELVFRVGYDHEEYWDTLR